jgi:hypothetical protein
MLRIVTISTSSRLYVIGDYSWFYFFIANSFVVLCIIFLHGVGILCTEETAPMFISLSYLEEFNEENVG